MKLPFAELFNCSCDIAVAVPYDIQLNIAQLSFCGRDKR